MESASFSIHFEPVDPRGLKTFATLHHEREEFWRSTVKIDPDRVDAEIELCEKRFLQTFSARLKEVFTSNTRVRQGTIEDRRSKSPQYNFTGKDQLRFTIEKIEYGSLDAKILVEGAQTLASAFSGRIEVLNEFLEQYTPRAFVASLPIDAVSELPVTATIADPDAQMSAAFSAYLKQQKTATTQGPTAASKTSKNITQQESQRPGQKAPQVPPVPANVASLPTPLGLDASATLPEATQVAKDGAPTAANSATVALSPASSATRTSEHPTTYAQSSVSVEDDAETLRTESHAIHITESGASRPIHAPQVLVLPPSFNPQQNYDLDAASKRTNRFWIAANLSLLFPVLLALVVLAIVYHGLTEDRAQLAARQKELESQIAARQKDLEDKIATRQKELDLREQQIRDLMLDREKRLFEALPLTKSEVPRSNQKL